MIRMTRKLLLSLLFCCIYKTLSLVNLLSGIIAYPIVSPRAIQQWIINPVNPTASTVQFTFEFMNMRQVELRIYEYVPTNSNGFGDLLYNCVNCGTLLPPSFYSRTGAVTVFVKANSGIGFQESDFRLKYICSPTAITGRLGNLSTKLNAGYGKIRPTRSNNLLPASSYQEWIITQDPGATITFSFATFSLGKASTAVVTIFDSLNNQGNIIFTGRIDNDRPDFWFYSYTGNALVTVTVGSTDSTADFTLSYYTDMNLYACGAFLQPDVLLDNSFILSDGSKSTQLMRRGERCVWRISPINGDTVSLVFQWVSLKFGSSIMVYDGVDNNAVVLWNGNGATETLPPIITSSSKSLYVDYRSDPSNTVRFLGFLGEFTSNYVGSLGSGRGFTTLGMSSELFITPPGKSIEQPSSSNYTWYIKPQFISGPITFAFNQLSLSSFDRVVIYDGPTTGAKVLASFSGLNSRSTPDRWFTTSKSSATVQSFTSAISTPKFSLAYFADGPHYHCGFTRNPAVLMASSMTITDGSSSAETIYRNQYCEWTISPAESSAVVMFFSRFGVLGGSLKIYIGSVADGTLFSEISNTLSVPAPLFLPYSTIGISFTTSGALVDGLGFSLTYYGVKSSRSFSGNDLMYFYSSSLLSWKLGTSLLNARKLESLSHGVKEYATNDLSVLEGNTQHDLALSDITISPGTNHTWILSLASIGGIYFAFTRINFDSDCTNTYLDIYDGTTTYAPLLKRFCGKSLNLPYQWLKTTKNSAILNFVTKEIVDTVGNFELSYYSDGDNNHCGFHVNPAILTAPSMIFTDGSSSSILMFSNEACTWHIIPNLLQVSSTVTKSFTIVLEFLECDMRGGQVAVYDGTSSNSNLLWQCIDCSSIPRTIISSTGRMRVDYFSRSVRGPGTGFRAVYWTIVDNVWRSNSIGVEPQIMLELPLNFAMNADTNNQSSAIRLAVSTSSAILSFFPKYKSINNMLRSEAVDGRIDNMFESHATPINTCGIIQNKGKNFIFNEEIYSLPTQDTKTYLHSTASEKQLLYVQGIYDHTDFNSADTRFHAVDTCKYMLDGGSNQAIIFTINSLLTTVNGRLRIFGGVFGNDAVIYDSNKAPVLTTGTLQGVTIVVAPCGKALIVLESFATNDSTGSVDYSMNLNYKVMDGDTGAVCDAYVKSLLPKEKKEILTEDETIGLIIVGGFVVFCLAMFYGSKYKAKHGYLLYPSKPSADSTRRYTTITPAYPRYNRRWDNIRNKFLRRGHCCVCKNMNLPVIGLPCSHGICLEDLTGYLESALGDIGMFPVKCPMHFDNCKGIIEPKHAKRILSEIQYNKFLEFSDRATYGDGMRCIFCENFVNFPEQMKNVVRVECPYCVQPFCIRCKKAWHYNGKCPLEDVDDSLEDWRVSSGAQRCPSCRKLIEKDDPETCHHMVHKITDPISCIKDRTDFCYLCGEEITADYPHDEVRSVGVNHFPNGVFQKCRIILKREKEEERNRLKRIRRMNTRAGKGFTNSPRMSNNSVVPISAELNTDEFDLDVSTPQGSPSRQPLIREAPRNEAHAHTYNFDQQWNQAVSGMHQQITPTARPSSARAQYYRQQQQRMSSPTTPTITSTINDLNSPTRGRANNNPYVFHD